MHPSWFKYLPFFTIILCCCYRIYRIVQKNERYHIQKALRLLVRDVRLLPTRYHSNSYIIVCTHCRYGQCLSYILPKITVGFRLHLLEYMVQWATQRRVQIPSATASHQPTVLWILPKFYYSLSQYFLILMKIPSDLTLPYSRITVNSIFIMQFFGTRYICNVIFDY